MTEVSTEAVGWREADPALGKEAEVGWEELEEELVEVTVALEGKEGWVVFSVVWAEIWEGWARPEDWEEVAAPVSRIG